MNNTWWTPRELSDVVSFLRNGSTSGITAGMQAALLDSALSESGQPLGIAHSLLSCDEALELIRDSYKTLNKCMEHYETYDDIEVFFPTEEINEAFTRLVEVTQYVYSDTELSKLLQNVQSEFGDRLIQICQNGESALELFHARQVVSWLDENFELAEAYIKSEADYRRVSASGVESEYRKKTAWLNKLLSLPGMMAFPYLDNYREMVEKGEYSLASEGVPTQDSYRLAFIGSGPLPLTAIMWALYDDVMEARTESIVCVDISSEAIDLSTRLIKYLERLEILKPGKISFICEDIANIRLGGSLSLEHGIIPADVCFIAGMIPQSKAELFIQSMDEAIKPQVLVLIRDANGLSAGVLYYPYDRTFIQQEGFEAFGESIPFTGLLEAHRVFSGRTFRIVPASIVNNTVAFRYSRQKVFRSH